jgi:hypothetical protein
MNVVVVVFHLRTIFSGFLEYFEIKLTFIVL